MSRDIIPVTVLSGNLGAGKTTVHNHVLQESKDLDTGRFDFEEASRSAGWLRELQEPHASAEEEHGVTSLVFETRRPFHPERFADLLDEMPTSVVRAKGHFWLAGREKEALVLNIAGRSIRVGPGGEWIATLPSDERDKYFDTYPELEATWDDEWGDRSTQLVVIGADIDHDDFRDKLAMCVLTDQEMTGDWSAFEDWFPTFEAREQLDRSEQEHEQQNSSEEIGLAD